MIKGNFIAFIFIAFILYNFCHWLDSLAKW